MREKRTKAPPSAEPVVALHADAGVYGETAMTLPVECICGSVWVEQFVSYQVAVVALMKVRSGRTGAFIA